MQAQISTSQWPQDGYWPQLIERYKIAYKSRTIDALGYNKYILNGPDCYTSDSYSEDINALKEYRDANLLKVTYILLVFDSKLLRVFLIYRMIGVFHLVFFNCKQVNIFFESLDVEEVKEKKQYPTVWDFLNTLGGALSLFIGASLTSTLEILELFLRVIIASFCSVFVKY